MSKLKKNGEQELIENGHDQQTHFLPFVTWNDKPKRRSRLKNPKFGENREEAGT